MEGPYRAVKQAAKGTVARQASSAGSGVDGPSAVGDL